MTELNNTNFDTVIKGDKPVLVDFWAGWCMPCKILGPVFEEISNEMSNEANFAKLDIDDNSELASKHGVASIPTLILFKEGKEVDRMVGVQPKDAIINLVKNHL